MRTLSAIDATVSSSPIIAKPPEQSPLHSPVPYLFGGLAAMLALIGFALLLLACSYWNISGCLGNQSDQNEEEKEKPSTEDKSLKVYEEKFVVIMAGDEIPTFLATPICIKASTFEDVYSLNHQNKKDEVENPKGEETTTATATATATESSDENRATQEETQNQQHHHQDH